MAQVINSAEKGVDRSDMECSDPTTIIDDTSSAKKLKQARLPFKPIGPKSQMTLTPHGMPKKRKLSDQESPSAKAPKVVSKHQTERVKLDVPEKPQLETAEHDNEVSSSSEAENIPLGTLHKRKALETNILERFIRKSSQEEISSTNEVVDLTDDVEGSTNLLENASTSNLEVASSKEVGNRDSETMITDEGVKSMQRENVELNSNDVQTGTSNTNNQDAETESICKFDNSSISKENGKRKLPDVDLTEASKVCKVVVMDINTLKDVEMSSVEGPQTIKSDTNEVAVALGKNYLEVSAISNKSQDMDKSSGVNTSSSSAKTESEDESSASSNDSEDENNISVGDVSISDQGTSSSANTSACKTPMAKGGNISATKTPGGSSVQTSTPKSTRRRPTSLKMSEIKSQEKKQEREAMRQRIREQKERERQERKEKKEQERLEAKKKKDEEKAEKEKKKNEEKEKKERERREKKEQLEREKMEKLQQKEEEKKKKQEVIDAKLEEKKKKEEEKKMKEEEKLKEEEEKNKKKIKEKESFTNFFIKKTQQQVKPKETSQFFMEFEVKKDMHLAPPWRRQLGEDAKSVVDDHLQKQDCGCLYMEEIKNPAYQKGSSQRTLPRQVETTPELDGEEEVKCLEENEEKKKNLERHHCKLLQFHTNYRPPYYGTWRKTSKVIKPIKPFNQDTDLFDYEVDSDDEWEEEEPGESVSSSEDEGDEKEDEPEEEEEDGWMVPHGYLSEDEGCDQDEEVTPDVLKARQMAKQEAWEAEQKRQKQPVRAIVIGCVWEGDEVAEKLAEKLAAFQAVCLLTVPIDTKSRRAADNSSTGAKDGEKLFGKGNRKPVPEEAMPDLIRLLHGNMIGIKKLIKEFRLYWKKKTSNSLGDADSDNMDIDESITDKNTSTLDESCPEEKASKDTETDVGSTEGDGGKSNESADGCGMSKRQLEIKITSIAVREKRSDFKKVCWYVHEKVLKQYKMEDLPLPNTWQYVSKGLIRVKNEEACGRRTPNNLSESFTDSVPIIMKEDEEGEAKALPKDQPSIMQFARKMQPSELPQPKIRRIELKPATSTTPANAGAKRVESPVADLDSSANEEVLAPYKTLPKDQRSIMDFAKKGSAKTANVVPLKSGNVPEKPVTPSPIVVPVKLGNVAKKTVTPTPIVPIKSGNVAKKTVIPTTITVPQKAGNVAKKTVTPSPIVVPEKSGIVAKKTVTPPKALATDLVNQKPKPSVPREITPKPLPAKLSKCKEAPATQISVVTSNEQSATVVNDKEESMDTDDCIILD